MGGGFVLVFGRGVLIASSHTNRGRSIGCALLAVSLGVDNLLNLFQLNFNCYWGPSTLELHCLGRGAEAISSGASNSEQHRMPDAKGRLISIGKVERKQPLSAEIAVAAETAVVGGQLSGLFT